MYKFIYRESDTVVCNSAIEAVKYFDSKGWGFHNWTIYKNDTIISLDEFFAELDEERVKRVNEILGA